MPTIPENTETAESPEGLANALVREYLNRRGLVKTLEALKDEEKFSGTMISSRQVLSTKLGIDNILASNKKKKPVLEAVVQYLMKRKEKLSSPTQKVEAINANPQTLATDRSDSILDKDVKNISSELKLTDRLKPLKRRTSLQNSWSNEPVSTVAHKEPIVAKFDELVIQDAMDEDFIIQPKNSLITQPSTPLKNNNVVAKNISQQEAFDIRNLLLGSSSLDTSGPRSLKNFSMEWKHKAFMFNNEPELKYGLTQLKGGPCGLLAVVQAFVLKYLRNCCKFQKNLIEQYRVGALIDSLTEIIWQAGANNAVVAISAGRRVLDAFTIKGIKFIPDGVLDSIVIREFSTKDSLKMFMTENIDQFYCQNVSPTISNGLLNFLISLVLTRGVSNIISDMDEPETTLIAMHNYCTQEMVSLCMVGKALSNVFDGDITLGDEGSKDVKILKGIHQQSQFGYITLFEHYQSMKVGQYMKNSKEPILVVCSESHYTVLFSKDQPEVFKEHENAMKIDLYYYDQLANQNEEIRLTISFGKSLESHAQMNRKKDLTPPLEHCIRTKYLNADIDWNGTDPLL